MAYKIRIIAVGKIKESYILCGIKEYEKRLQPFCKFEIAEIKDEGKAKESERLQNLIDSSTYVLDSCGKSIDSEDFADLIKKQEHITFIIGGPDGIDDNVKQKANLLSLSKMTFTHEMCRLFLIEQIYRGFMIINKRSYHK